LKGTINAIVSGTLSMTEVLFYLGGAAIGGYIFTWIINKIMAHLGRYSIVNLLYLIIFNILGFLSYFFLNYVCNCLYDSYDNN